jgi:Secretion system C-terminal sorting domain
MKRSILLLLFVPLFTMAFSQITIKRADYPLSDVVVDSFVYRDIGITGLAIPQRGANRLWDFTTIKDTNKTTTIYNTPANLSSLPAYFKDATFVPSRIRPTFGSYSIIDSLFRRLDSTGVYILGYSRGSGSFLITAQTGGSSDSLWFLPRTKRFTPPPYQVKLPMISTTISKVMTIDSVPYQIKWVSAGYATRANINHIRFAEFTTEIIGWGTLKLRNPVVGRPNLEFGVLLERYAELRQDSFYLNGAPMPQRILDSFRLGQGKRDTTTIQYNFRGIGFRRGIINFVMSTDEAFIIAANRVIEPSQNLQSGSKDLASYDVPLTVFPNPVTEGVNFTFDKKTNSTWHAMIYNEAGQMIDLQSINAPIGNLTHRIALDKSLPSGHYFINILDETSLIRSNGRFVKL